MTSLIGIVLFPFHKYFKHQQEPLPTW